MVDSKPSLRTIDFTHRSSPNGRLRCTHCRTATNSASVSGVLTRSTQFGKRRIGQGESSFGSGSGD